MARSVLRGKHITLNAFAIKQGKRKINELRFQLEGRKQEAKVTGDRTEVAEFKYREREESEHREPVLQKGQLNRL